MIQIIPTQNTASRTFGWVQDPGNFRSLCDVAAIFVPGSPTHRALETEILPRLVEARDGRDALIAALGQRPLRIKYAHLVGAGFSSRKDSRCNGIVQAAVKGQRRPFIGDWPANNFVRWAQALGFLKYHYSDDTFEITESGRQLVEARTAGKALNDRERELLTAALLAYPPAVRILGLLAGAEGAPLTKFELGRQLGFVGEGGFTSLPQTVLVRALAATADQEEKNRMKTDWDGSSDKYARMTAKWLEKLGLVEQMEKKLTVSVGGRDYTESIGQSYAITAAGLSALGRALGRSRHKRIPKNMSFEMMATKGSDREYLRTRRTYLLKAVSESAGTVTLAELQERLRAVHLTETISTIRDDLRGFVNIGLHLTVTDTACVWKDCVNDFVLPLPQKLARSTLSEQKEQVRAALTCLSHEYLSLIDLAYDSAQNRLFEMKTLELLTEECGFGGAHLGGSRKPDGVAYTVGPGSNYGVIIDTKAYSQGYSLPISQADEMERYVRENQTRDQKINPNGWWRSFGETPDRYYFLFISGHFSGNVAAHLKRICLNTGVSGGALNVKNLLLLADAIKSGSMTRQEMAEQLFQNREFSFGGDDFQLSL